MKFVETHLTSHHFFHKPHKWFLAFLASPVHAAEIHYKRKYHLTFAHAKKLFVFDMLLLASTVFLFCGTVFWYTYDPTVTELVSISISSPEERIQSGDFATYKVHYRNNSDVTLSLVNLALLLPSGFEITTTTPDTRSADQVFTLVDIPAGAEGAISFSGWFYDVPGQENTITATLSYIQKHESRREVIARQALTTLRGSVLETTLDIPTTILGQGTVPATITITNTGVRPLEGISIPLSSEGELTLINMQPSKGIVTDAAWNIDVLAPEESVTLQGTLLSQIPASKRQIPLTITPTINIQNGNTLQQKTEEQILHVLHPAVDIQTSIAETNRIATPGDIVPMDIHITNQGDATLERLVLTIPLTDAMNRTQMAQQNTGRLSSEGFVITQAQHAALQSLSPGSTATISIKIPVSYAQRGTDVVLRLTPTVQAAIPAIPSAIFTQTAEPSPEVKIGSQLLLSAESRYYTDEGDQLGRGPLPPQTGKETKYWAIITIQNTSSNIQNLRLSATVPAHVAWTGKTSVSHGADVLFNESTRQMQWQLNNLAPYQTVGIYAELAITPLAVDRGNTPRLLENIQAEATDTFIGATLLRSHQPIDTSLQNDTQAKRQGVKVQ